MSKSVDRLLQYGISTTLADRADAVGLTATKIRTLSQIDIVSKFQLTPAEATELKTSVNRSPIEDHIVTALLEASNFLCNVCKGEKGKSYILHHIIPYEKTQDNSYNNLIVLCPTDHDLAHRGGLTLGITSDQLRTVKKKWEYQVEVINAQRAAKTMNVNDDAIDYVNVMRIEELCIKLFNSIPVTTVSLYLRRKGIIGSGDRFDAKFVRNELSNGAYLFDYTNSSETEHYRQLMQKIGEVIDFHDMSEATHTGYKSLKNLEGEYTFFIGGVYAKRPELPINHSTPPIEMYYPTKRIRINWHLDPNYLMSMSAIARMGLKNRYIIYCLVRTVEVNHPGKAISVTASPLLIAQPTKYVHRTPTIAYQRQFEKIQELNRALEDDQGSECDY